MYRSILVPLDGSPVGERAIPIALRVARHAGAQVDLAHVHEAIGLGGGIPMIDTRLDTEVKNGMRTALERLRERIATRAGVTLTASFLEGEIVPELLAHVKAREIDLVVMTTHGRGGVSRVWLGSVADALVRQLRIPVLLGRRAAVVRGGAKAPPFRRVLVPLDGSAFAEDVLAHAVALGAPDRTSSRSPRMARAHSRAWCSAAWLTRSFVVQPSRFSSSGRRRCPRRRNSQLDRHRTLGLPHRILSGASSAAASVTRRSV